MDDERSCRTCGKHSGVEERFESIEKAVSLAREIMDHRLDTMNHIYAEMRSQTATFVPRAELMLLFENLSTQMKNLQSSFDKASGARRWTDWLIVFAWGAMLLIGVKLLVGK